MPRRELDLEIRRKGRRETVLSVEADAGDTGALCLLLRGWLEGEGWDRGRWAEFEAVARPAGAGRVLARVRTGPV